MVCGSAAMPSLRFSALPERFPSASRRPCPTCPSWSQRFLRGQIFFRDGGRRGVPAKAGAARATVRGGFRPAAGASLCAPRGRGSLPGVPAAGVAFGPVRSGALWLAASGEGTGRQRGSALSRGRTPARLSASCPGASLSKSARPATCRPCPRTNPPVAGALSCPDRNEARELNVETSRTSTVPGAQGRGVMWPGAVRLVSRGARVCPFLTVADRWPPLSRSLPSRSLSPWRFSGESVVAIRMCLDDQLSSVAL